MGTRKVVLVGYPAAELLDIACVTSTFSLVNDRARKRHYDVVLATPGGRPITCGSGLTLQGQEALERLVGPLDTLVVSGGLGHEKAAADPVLVGHVRRLARESRRVASVCTGASILAAAGLLAGRRATTHWRFARRFAERHPEVVVDHITAHLSDDLTTASLAAAAGVSERHLTRLFLKHLGLPPGRYIRRARAEAAAHLLATTTLPMSAIATRCGFGTPETLRQAFTARYGISPSRYRHTQTLRRQ